MSNNTLAHFFRASNPRIFPPLSRKCSWNIEKLFSEFRNASNLRRVVGKIFISFHWLCTGTLNLIELELFHKRNPNKNLTKEKYQIFSVSILESLNRMYAFDGKPSCKSLNFRSDARHWAHRGWCAQHADISETLMYFILLFLRNSSCSINVQCKYVPKWKLPQPAAKWLSVTIRIASVILSSLDYAPSPMDAFETVSETGFDPTALGSMLRSITVNIETRNENFSNTKIMSNWLFYFKTSK